LSFTFYPPKTVSRELVILQPEIVFKLGISGWYLAWPYRKQPCRLICRFPPFWFTFTRHQADYWTLLVPLSTYHQVSHAPAKRALADDPSGWTVPLRSPTGHLVCAVQAMRCYPAQQPPNHSNLPKLLLLRAFSLQGRNYHYYNTPACPGEHHP